MGENPAAEEIRKFKRSAWQNTTRWYDNATKGYSVGKERERHICSKFARGTILDVGSGSGRISTDLKSKGQNVFAMDISVGMLTVQKDMVPCVCGDAEKLPFADETFDTVMATSLLIHFPNWDDILRELIRVLKSEGVLLFEVSSKEHLEFSKVYKPTIDEQYSTLETFEAFISIRKLNEILVKEGMHLKQVIPYDYFNSNEILHGLIRDTAVDKNDEEFGHLKGLPEFVPFWCWLEENIFAYFPLGLSHKNFIVASKTNGKRTVSYASHSGVTQSLEDVLGKALKVLNEKKEQLLIFYAEVLNPGNGMMCLYRKLTELLFPVIELDVISLSHLIDKTAMTKKEAYLLETLCRYEFGYWTEKFVTSWYKNLSQTDHMSIYGVPIGPIVEYDLMPNCILQTPEKIYWNKGDCNEL